MPGLGAGMSLGPRNQHCGRNLRDAIRLNTRQYAAIRGNTRRHEATRGDTKQYAAPYPDYRQTQPAGGSTLRVYHPAPRSDSRGQACLPRQLKLFREKPLSNTRELFTPKDRRYGSSQTATGSTLRTKGAVGVRNNKLGHVDATSESADK
jgi:hypothetical protein